MICLHDIRIENADYVAQMDYILITEHFIMVLETKRLNGDIIVNEAGEFIRRFKTKDGRVFKEEGMYSPISQNERHVRILENFLKSKNIIKKIPIYSAVIIANPKAIINRNKAPYAIKNGIYKHDQITSMLEKLISKCNKDGKILESNMINIANFLIENNKEITFDYNAKYGLTDEDFKDSNIEPDSKKVAEVNVESIHEKEIVKEIREEIEYNREQVDKDKEVNISTDNKKDELYEELRKYRYEKAKEEGNKPYFLFNNNTLNELVSNNPKNKDELIKIQGFGQVKVDKYGDDILRIIKDYL